MLTTSVRQEARKIVQKFECLPLAVDQAAAYIARNTTMPLERYLPRYEAKAKEILNDNSRLWPVYKQTCMTTWEMSFQAVREKSRQASVLLQVCSFSVMKMYGENFCEDLSLGTTKSCPVRIGSEGLEAD